MWTDCSASVCSIPGDMRAIQGFRFDTDARHGVTSLNGPCCQLPSSQLRKLMCKGASDRPCWHDAKCGCGCRFVVVVEKDAVFQRLVEEGFCGATDSILVTAKGMPDLCTRVFLQILTTFYPTLMSVAGERHQEQLSLSSRASFRSNS